MNTQKQDIIKALKTGWISPLDALKQAGTMKLATRVGELRQQGYLILDRWHESKKFKEYKLIKGVK